MKILLAVILISILPNPAFAESVYDRVMKSGKIRCGYAPWSIYLARDPNTGKMSGIYHDYVEEMGKNLSLKIEWTEEVGDAEAITALDSGRIDAYCGIMGWNAERARIVDFVTPLHYIGVFLYAREGDKRFDNNLAAVNKPDVKIVSVDGDIFAKVAKLDFPNATPFSMPQMTTEAETYLSIADGKADLVLNEPASASDYMKNNPRKIRKVSLESPLRFYAASIVVKGGEDRFRRMLDVATVEMHGSGAVEKIISLYETQKGSILRVSKPYEARP